MQFLVPRYDPWMVVVSMAIAGFASYVALDLAERVHRGGRLARHWWACGSLVLGTGIWSMHFVGMLAFSLPTPLGYGALYTALAWLAAVAACAVALAAAGQETLGARRFALASAATGAGIFSMHYLGMAALDMAPGIVWDMALVAASRAIALVASGAALLIFFGLRRVGVRHRLRWRLFAAALMGTAISGMHYTGMAAASFPVGSICLSADALSGSLLDELVEVAAFSLLTATLVVSIFDARMQSRMARLAESLQEANVRIVRERERFRALTGLSSDWFWEQDPELRFTIVSNGFAEGAGREPGSYLGKLPWECDWIDIDAQTWQFYRSSLERHESFRDFVVPHIDARGRVRAMSLSGAPIYDEAGTFLGYRGIGRDVTMRRQQKQRDGVQHAVTRLLADSTSAAVAMPDIIRAICRSCEWNGGLFQEIEAGDDLRCKERWSEADDAPTFDALARCRTAAQQDRIATEAGLDGRFACPVRAGERLFGTLDFRFPAAQQADAATLEVVENLGLQIGQSIARWEAEAHVRDDLERLADRVAERTRALSDANRDLERAKLGAEDASRAKSAFLAAMSHEIRTPMNGVIGMIEVLAQSSLAEDQADAVRTIRGSAFSLLGLIDDVLDFSKIEAGHLEIERAPVALVELVEGVCDMLAPEAAHKGVDVRLFVEPSLPEQVWSDAMRLRQMLANLVGNAVKFSGGRSDRRGQVSVRLERVDGAPQRLSIAVADNGIGMEAAALEHLFEAFVQAEASTTRRFGGTGLGLVICKRLVMLMAGEIDVASEPGIGSTFTVTLPLEGAPDAMAATSIDLRGVDCVVVANAGVDAGDVRAYLEHAGAGVCVAADAALALGLAGSLDGRLVIVQHVASSAAAVLAAQAPFLALPHVHHVFLVHRPGTLAASALAPGATLADATLHRGALQRAVAIAAGMASAACAANDSPVRAAHERRTAPSIAEARAEGSLVLIAEDDPVNQKVILKQLALLGHAGEVAANGEEALRLWQQGGHALLLSDLHMPELDGYALARAIRAQESSRPEPERMPILALTANALREEASRVRAAGMDEYLTKPIQLAALGAALERWLPRRAHRDALAAIQAAPKAAPAAPAVDISVLQSLVGDDMDTVREFLAEFLQTAREQAAEIVAACDAEDNRVVGAVAHKLKASSRSVGALALGDLCAELENTSRAGSRAELQVHRLRFEQAMHEAQACIVDALAAQAA